MSKYLNVLIQVCRRKFNYKRRYFERLSFLKNLKIIKKNLLIESKYSKFCNLISKKKIFTTLISIYYIYSIPQHKKLLSQAIKKMYKCSKKDNYCKRIKEIIGGSQKHKTSSNIDNYDTNIITDTNIINDNNGDVANIDINENSSDININKNDEPSVNKIRIQRWNPNGNRVEGICKYLED